MTWKDEPATSGQLTTIRDFYAREIGWNRAMGLVGEMKHNNITTGQASKEIARLYDCKAHGQPTGPEQ